MNPTSFKNETGRLYLDAIIRMNQTDAAQEMEMSKDTVNRYKHKFREMTPKERNLKIAQLALRNLAELD